MDDILSSALPESLNITGSEKTGRRSAIWRSEDYGL